MFGIGDYVVYGGEGVCKIENIGAIDVDGKKTEKIYYTLFPVYVAGTRVYTPVASDKVVMRRVLSKEETMALIDDIPNMELLKVADEKAREQVYREALRTCDCRELIRLIKTVYQRKQKRISGGKKVTAVDERYFKSAQDQLYGELAIPLAMERNEVEAYIKKCIEKSDTKG